MEVCELAPGEGRVGLRVCFVLELDLERDDIGSDGERVRSRGSCGMRLVSFFR